MARDSLVIRSGSPLKIAGMKDLICQNIGYFDLIVTLDIVVSSNYVISHYIINLI